MKSKFFTKSSKLRHCMLALSVALPAGAHAAGASEPSGLTDRLIIKYKTESALQNISSKTADRLERAGRAGQPWGLKFKKLRQTAAGADVIRLDRAVSLADAAQVAAEIAAQDSSVEYAEPDRIMRALFAPNDTRYNEQWDLFETTAGMRVAEAWDKSTGNGVTVAVLDTGYRPHADLAANIVGGYDFISDTFVSVDGNGRDSDASDPGDSMLAGECGGGYPSTNENSSWHGTHVSGTIAAVANNGEGVAGIAYNAKILPLRVLGKCGGYTSDIADAIIWASGGTVNGVPANANVAKVINLSLGGSGACDTTSQNAINSARSRGTVVVVAAGNEGVNASNSSPANCSGVVAVAATNRSGGRSYYSNYGSIVDVAAPGGDMRSSEGNGILSTLNTGATTPGADDYAFYQGTSMATPHVAAVAALMFAKNASLTPDDIESRLKSSARAFPATCSQCGSGLVDASAAVDAATAQTSSVNETETNNSRTAANTIASATTVNGAIGSRVDTDYFMVNLAAGKTLISTLNAVSATANYDLYVYNNSGALLSSSKNGAGITDTVSLTNSGASSAKRFVRVVYVAGGTGSTNGKYTLNLSW